MCVSIYCIISHIDRPQPLAYYNYSVTTLEWFVTMANRIVCCTCIVCPAAIITNFASTISSATVYSQFIKSLSRYNCGTLIKTDLHNYSFNGQQRGCYQISFITKQNTYTIQPKSAVMKLQPSKALPSNFNDKTSSCSGFAVHYFHLYWHLV